MSAAPGSSGRGARGRWRRVRLVARGVGIVVVVALVARWSFGLRGGSGVGQAAGVSLSELPAGTVDTIAGGLDTPWALDFLAGGDLLITERGGRLVRLDSRGRPVGAWPVPGVREVGEAGLLGVAAHPTFPGPPWIYVYLTGTADGVSENRLERYRLDPSGLSERSVLIDGIPGGFVHDGGRIGFGPDGALYVTTGDAGTSERSRDWGSLGGKILRVDTAGRPAAGNPRATVVYSVGHRNPQGLAWDGDRVLWSTEHGRSVMGSGLDELNRIEPGGDYGWPTAEGNGTAPGTVAPVVHSGTRATWAPSGAAWLGGILWFGGLRGAALYAFDPAVDPTSRGAVRAHLSADFGRIRDVRAGPDGRLWLLTSNRDGRGRPGPRDDLLVALEPDALRR